MSLLKGGILALKGTGQARVFKALNRLNSRLSTPFHKKVALKQGLRLEFTNYKQKAQNSLKVCKKC